MFKTDVRVDDDAGDVNEDRLTALRKRADIEAKNCTVFISNDPTELKRSLMRFVFLRRSIFVFLGRILNNYSRAI